MPNAETSQPRAVTDRLARVETQMEQLVGEVRSIAETLRIANLSTTEAIQARHAENQQALQRFAAEADNAIADLAKRQELATRTPWGVLASWAGVVLAIGGVFGAIVVREVDETNFEVRGMRSEFSDHRATQAYDDGKRDERDRWLERAITNGSR